MKPGDRLHAGAPTPTALWARIADSALRGDHLTLSVDEVRVLAGMLRGAVQVLQKAESDELSAAVERTASVEALNAATMSAGRAQGYRAGAIRVRQALGMSVEDVAPQHFAPLVPPWMRAWFGAGDTGLSSITIATVMLDLPFELTLQRKHGSAPHDNGDVGRCVRLLDHAAEHGVDWRARLPELVARVPEWAPLVPRWADIETAYREDMAAHRAWQAAGHDRNLRKQGRKLVHGSGYVKSPPLRCYHLVSVLLGRRDPYAGETVPWEREPTGRTP